MGDLRATAPTRRVADPWRTGLRRSCLVVVVALGLGSCERLGRHDPALRAAFTPRSVRVAKVEMRSGAAGLTASGYLVARDEADVGADLSGYRIAKVLVDEGDLVQAGQPLAVMDDSLLRAQIAQQSALAAQQATLVRQAGAEAQRAMSLQGKGVLSEEAMQARMFKVEAARSAAQAQQAQLQDLEVRRAHLVIRAPVSGLVLERNVRLGDMSAPSAPPMFRIARDSQIELMAQAPESDLYRINVGDPVDVTLADGAHVQGRVRLISDRIDQQTKLGSVRVALSLPDDNSGLRGRWTAKAGLRGRIGGPDAQIADAVLEAPPEQSAKTPTLRPQLRVGAFATASFNGVTTDAPSVPEAAVRYDTDGASVMAVQPDNRVRKVQVKTGARGDGYVQLLQGPPPGTEVLLGAAAFVVDGEAVQPIRTAAN